MIGEVRDQPAGAVLVTLGMAEAEWWTCSSAIPCRVFAEALQCQLHAI